MDPENESPIICVLPRRHTRTPGDRVREKEGYVPNETPLHDQDVAEGSFICACIYRVTRMLSSFKYSFLLFGQDEFKKDSYFYLDNLHN